MKKYLTYDEPATVRDEHQDARDAMNCRCDWKPGSQHRWKCPATGYSGGAVPLEMAVKK